MTLATDNLEKLGIDARAAAKEMARGSSQQKDAALNNLAQALLDNEAEILAANEKDIEENRRMGLADNLLDRILISSQRLKAMSDGVRLIVGLPDPIGEMFDTHVRPNGLQVGKRRVPLGVVASIYENRPNVTIDISALCIKSGNACILRGGKEAIHSNTALARLVGESLRAAGLPETGAQLVGSVDRRLVAALLEMSEYIDLMIPRGGAEFIRYVSENAAMPVVAGGVGVCHTYLDASADVAKAVEIANNAKTRRPSVCNALDTLLAHRDTADTLLPAVARRWADAGVEMRCDERALSILSNCDGLKLRPAQPDDFGTEFLSLTAAVKVVDSMEEALRHIDRYGSGHSEAIITEDYTAANRFLQEVDAAAVFVNASTYFCDGGEFGLGAEVGISTQKFHARGPMGIRELTTYKWIVLGNGQIRV